MLPTLAQIAVEFLDLYQQKENTLKSYLATLTPLLSYYGSRPIHELTPSDLAEYLETLAHLAESTRNRHRTIIATFFNYALKQGYILVNPLSLLPSYPLTKTDIRYFSPEQLEFLYSLLKQQITLNGCRLHAVIHLLHRTGAKVSQVLGLDLSDLDLESCQLSIDSRWCSYTEDARLVLQVYLQRYRHSSSDCLAVFTAQNKRNRAVSRLSYSLLYLDWQKLLEPYQDFHHYTLNDFRHTFAMERIDLMGIEQLQALMGHKDIKMTLRYKYIYKLT